MKFLSGIHTFERINDELVVKLETWHKTSQGLFPETKVYAFPHWRDLGRGKVIKEIIISTFPPSRWPHLWHLEFLSPDAPGVIMTIAHILRKKSINIYIQESLVANSANEFKVSLLVDLEHYINALKSENKILRENSELKFLQDQIKSDLKSSINELKELKEQDVKLEISLAEPVNYLAEKCVYDIRDQVDQDRLKDYQSHDYMPISVKNDQISIPIHIQHDLKLLNQNETIQGTIFSDSEDKYLIIRLFNPKDCVAFIDIEHKNMLGAIERFSTIIFNECHDHKYNIISAYNRVKDIQDTCHWYALIDVTSNPERLESLFRKIDSIKEIASVKLTVEAYSNGLLARKVEDLRLPEKRKQPTTTVLKKTPQIDSGAIDHEKITLKDLVHFIGRLNLKAAGALGGILIGLISTAFLFGRQVGENSANRTIESIIKSDLSLDGVQNVATANLQYQNNSFRSNNCYFYLNAEGKLFRSEIMEDDIDVQAKIIGEGFNRFLGHSAINDSTVIAWSKDGTMYRFNYFGEVLSASRDAVKIGNGFVGSLCIFALDHAVLNIRIDGSGYKFPIKGGVLDVGNDGSGYRLYN
jgi:uncharacterized protein with ACT and thioredoxin-like domain